MYLTVSAEWRSHGEQHTASTSATASVQADFIIHHVRILVKSQLPQRRQSDGELDRQRDHGPRAESRLRRYRSVSAVDTASVISLTL